MNRHSLIALTFVLIVTGCESGASSSSAEGAGDPAVAPAPAATARIDLDAAGASIKGGKVKNASELEASLNRQPGQRVDVDADGKPDQLQVVEDPQAKRRRFRVRALPSSKKSASPDAVAVPVATIDVEPVGSEARVTLRPINDDVAVVTFQAPVVVGTFCHWVLVVERPVFVGAAYVVVHEVHVEHAKFKHKKHKHKKW